MREREQSAGANAYVIAGPNGAGKTTFAREFLPLYAHCKNFINADLIAQGLSPFSPEDAAFRAGRLVLSEIASMAARRMDFGFETTLAGRSYIPMIHDLKKRGYQIHFFFLWLPSVDLAISRIKQRVLRGGHSVPEADIRRRFERSNRNFLVDYSALADSWMLFDNSGDVPAPIASLEVGSLVIMQEEKYRELIQRYGRKPQDFSGSSQASIT